MLMQILHVRSSYQLHLRIFLTVRVLSSAIASPVPRFFFLKPFSRIAPFEAIANYKMGYTAPPE